MLPAFMVLSNVQIYSIARHKPKDLTELLNIYGFGEKKVNKYGEDIIALLNSI